MKPSNTPTGATGRKNVNRILMLGPAMDAKGGIAKVASDYDSAGLFDQFEIKYIPTYTDKNASLKIGYFAKSFLVYFSYILKAKIVHLHTSYGWSFRRKSIFNILSKVLKRKTILHLHGSTFDKWFYALTVAEKKYVKWVLGKTDLVITLSSNWENIVCDIQPKSRVVVLPNALNVSRDSLRVKNKSPKQPYKILFLGRLGRRKGVYDILESVKILPPNKYKFILAGDGEITKIKNIVQQIGRQDDIEITGWVDEKEKIKLLNDSDVMILPSYNEGLPISILEGMAFGLPIISTDVGGITLAVKNKVNGFIIPTSAPTVMAQKIEQIFSDLTIWKHLSLSSFGIFERNFTIKNLQYKLNAVYSYLTG